MKKLLMVSALVAGSALLSGLAAAQEVGKVLSSTPVLKRVTEPKSTCVDDADGKQRCSTQMVTEDRNIGYKVVYEYAGQQHTVQLPFPPGATIALEVTPAVQGASAGTVSVAEPSYYSEPSPQVVEREVRERVYVESPYYPYSYGPYYPGYYSPLYPFVGIGLGYSFGYYGHGWRGGYRGGHWRR